MPKPGLFITFEGGEGSGKTTLIEKIKGWYQEQGEEVIVTREPGGVLLGEEIRALLLETREAKVSPIAELLLFLAARAQHVEELIRPSLEEGKIVLCDRFSDSTVAYQGYARELGVEESLHLCQVATGSLDPNLTFYLDITPDIGLERARGTTKTEKKDRIEAEKIEFHEKVRQGFLSLAERFSSRIHTLNASEKPDQVFKQAVEVLKRV